MFTYIKAKNFKSLKNIEFNLNRTKTKTNQLISIYGENGSGKTNIVDLFVILQKLTFARCADIIFNKMRMEFIEMQKDLVEQPNLNLKSFFSPVIELEKYRMLNENAPTEIEYGFKINNKEGIYSIKFDNEILEEKIYYVADKQRAYLFEVCKEGEKIKKQLNNSIFKNEKYNDELIEEIDKYWGKYSFLSLLLEEKHEKNKEYVIKNISKNIFDVIDDFLSIVINEDKERYKTSIQRKRNNIQRGSIDKERLYEIKNKERILNIFFTQGYADIKAVNYKINERKGKLDYELYFKKNIGGKLKSIPAELESNGTKRILNQLETLSDSLLGKTVVIDEIDNGIHDLLMKNIIMSMKDEITGQLIITTHNTLLLEVLPKECIYILSSDYNGNKQIKSIKEYEQKVQRNNNARDLYLKGLFGGIPTTDYIDFEEIKYALEDAKKQKKDKNDN